MREKLIDLCKQANDELRLRCGCSTWGDFVDLLISNGVTLDNQVSSSKWIPVSERLPEKGEDVLVFVFDDYDKWVDTDFLMSNGEWVFENGDRHITHWMPLPEPPKEDE